MRYRAASGFARYGAFPGTIFVAGVLVSLVDVFVLGDWDPKWGPWGSLQFLLASLVPLTALAFFVCVLVTNGLRRRTAGWTTRRHLFAGIVAGLVVIVLLLTRVVLPLLDWLMDLFPDWLSGLGFGLVVLDAVVLAGVILAASTKRTAGRGPVLLALVRVRNMHGLADRLDERGFQDVWKSILCAVERFAEGIGASITSTDVSDPDGSRILCARLGNAPETWEDLPAATRHLSTDLQEILIPLPVHTTASVTLARDRCLYEMEKGRIVTVMGEAVSRVDGRSLEAPEDEDAILLDASVRDALEGTDPVQVVPRPHAPDEPRG